MLREPRKTITTGVPLSSDESKEIGNFRKKIYHAKNGTITVQLKSKYRKDSREVSVEGNAGTTDSIIPSISLGIQSTFQRRRYQSISGEQVYNIVLEDIRIERKVR